MCRPGLGKVIVIIPNGLAILVLCFDILIPYFSVRCIEVIAFLRL